jgi:uncharacterized protein YhfF
MTAQEMWEKYVEKSAIQNAHYEAWCFGDAPDKLAELVLSGEKTATASVAIWYREENEPMPSVDEYSVILNTKNEAVCVIQTTKVTVVPFDQVSAEHAYKEGEGDKSLAYWRAVHEAFFREELTHAGKTFDEKMDVVCEEFKVVYRR